MDEDQEGRRVDENVRVAVEAGDIPSATDMDPTLGKLGELGSLADRSRNWAGTLGRAHGAVRGPVRHTYGQPFSPTSASDQGANHESQDGDCSGQTGLEKMEMEPTGSESASTATSATRCERCGNAHDDACAHDDAGARYGARDRAPGGTPSLSIMDTRLSSLTGVGPASAGAAVRALGVPGQGGTEDGQESAQSSTRKQRRQRRRGALVAHARFLQFVFRRTTSRWPGCWSASGLAGKLWLRPVERFACRGGVNLAGPSVFAAQVDLASQATGWYRHYVSLLRRLNSGHTPVALVAFCGQGGLTEGVRRAGGAAHGVDGEAQPAYARRFGLETLSTGDPASVSELTDLRRRTKSFVTMASSHSRVRGGVQDGTSRSAVLDACEGAGGLYVLEAASGSRPVVGNHMCQLRGSYFGLHVDHPQTFEANFELRVDAALVGPGLALRRGTCLGCRRRWFRKDPFGRSSYTACCSGNLWSVQGDEPRGCTLFECAVAMGVDSDHMDYRGLARATPPAYGEYIFGQAAMRAVERRFGLKAITFDDYLANPERSRRQMSHWLRGVGGVSPDQGVEFHDAPVASSTGSGAVTSAPKGVPAATVVADHGTPRYRPVFLEGDEAPIAPATAETVLASEARELFYSWAGDYDVMVGPTAWWASMTEIKHVDHVGVGTALASLSGSNTLMFLPWGQLSALLPRIRAVVKSSPGARVTVQACGARDEATLRASGFKLVRRVRKGSPAYAEDGRDAVLARGCSFWALGGASCRSLGSVDYALAEANMDPLDRPGARVEPSSAKAARSYVPIPWERERWDIGLPRELDEMMAQRGVGIYPWEEVPPTEVPFYRWESQEGLLKSIAEADRGLLAGAMEYVPAHRLAEVLESSTISPWTIVDQGGGKWRLCHDYSVGTNRVVPSAAFSLPSVWDARSSIRPGSHFAKYDIRDGFWHVPIADDSKKRLVVRHPGTGRLMWASRLPFGYIESPRLFCSLTEAVIGRLRKQAAGLGIHFYVFVDDVLVIGDNEELTRKGMALLEAEFAARGLQWAPHKKRGPCRCIEFLGLLLCNVEGLRGITISRKRRASLMADIEAWLALEPHEGDLSAEPKKLASFLGKLVFVSQVVVGGRTYMQGMLSQFKGLLVDWQRGQVKPSGGEWRDLSVSQAFWRDLRWWREHLDTRSLAPLEGSAQGAEAVLTGTDASNWGTGQVLWLDGGREEASLVFTHAERRRPINWRELLGIVRVCEVGGERLRGKIVLIETDNMAAKGAASKLSSKAADMQELVRRLMRLGERHGFTLRVTHTPGSKLDRPDQTSRGDAIEESRFRLREGEFARLNGLYGPFTSFIGAERELASREPAEAPGGGTRRMWVHPTSSTVGSALRRVQETMVEFMGKRPTALALVPADGDPAWAKMLKHGLVIGHYPAGSPCLSAHTVSGWRDCTNRRPLSLVLFPRAAGARAVQLASPFALKSEAHAPQASPFSLKSETRVPRASPFALRSEVSVAAEARVVRLASHFALERDVRLAGSFVYALAEGGGVGSLCQVASDDGDELVVEYWRLDLTKAARKIGSGPVFLRERAQERETYEADPRQFWSVDHLVGPSVGSASGVVERRRFDFKLANTEIRLAGGVWAPAAEGWETATPEAVPAGGPAGPSPGGYVPFEAETAEDLDEVAADLGRLFVAQHVVNRGSEGRAAPREMKVRGGVPDGVGGACTQLCQYGGGGIVCGGCKLPFTLGEKMESRGCGFVHAQADCRQWADGATALQAADELELEASPKVFFGVYSDAVGISGIFNDLREVESATEDSAVFSSSRSFGTYEEAARFIRQTTVERASVPVTLETTVKGSLVKRAHLFEKLSDARLAMIDLCIAGKCGVAHDETSTACLGGCGRHLHVETCAQMGRGFAALGNFRCVTCRLSKLVVAGSTAKPSGEIERVVRRTMVLELNQGKETTAAGFADYTQLEERYALGMGRVLDGAALHLPRHNAESFKNFLTWMAQIEHDRWSRS